MTRNQTDLESRLAHLERTTDELSDEIARLSRALDTAERRLARLMQQAAEREFDEGGTVPLADQRPPHY